MNTNTSCLVMVTSPSFAGHTSGNTRSALYCLNKIDLRKPALITRRRPELNRRFYIPAGRAGAGLLSMGFLLAVNNACELQNTEREQSEHQQQVAPQRIEAEAH